MTVVAFRRNRDAEGRGKSDNSWIKHDFAERVISSQAYACRRAFPNHKILLIDGNAGDGEGVDMAQRDLFIGEVRSRPTPEILTRLAKRLGNTDVLLCERDQVKREQLWSRFPTSIIAAHHREIALAVRDHDFALWVSDPCGYSGHGVEHMRAVDKRVFTDFVIILNEHALKRVSSTAGSAWAPHREKYGEMIEPRWWLEQLGKRFLARSRLIPQSPNFQFRLMIASNYLADVARREPFTETMTVEDKAHA